MPRLTKRVVDSYKPNGRDYFVWDDQLPGFGLRVFASGSKSYLIQYRHSGRTRRATIGKHGVFTPEQARLEAKVLMGDIAKGEDPAELRFVKHKDPTVSELIDLYMREGPVMKPNKKESTWVADGRNLDIHVRPLIGNRKLKSLTRVDIQKFQADVTSGKSARKAQKTKPRGKSVVRGGAGIGARSTGSLSAMLTFAVERGLIDYNPAYGVRLNKRRKMERFLSSKELKALGEVLSEEAKQTEHVWVVAAIRLLILTGCRKGEILGLKWSQVDDEHNVLRLPDSKTGAKTVPIGQPVLDLLADLPRLGQSEYVLPSIKSDGPLVGLQKAWEDIRKKAGLDDVRLHDLRHSFASIAVAGGSSLFIVGKILGHKDSRTTEIYAHMADDPLKATVNSTSMKIAGLLGGTAKQVSNENTGAVPRMAAE
ncbi:MAG: site-specific integrase [Rhodospirillaceae bacterium]